MTKTSISSVGSCLLCSNIMLDNTSTFISNYIKVEIQSYKNIRGYLGFKYPFVLNYALLIKESSLN